MMGSVCEVWVGLDTTVREMDTLDVCVLQHSIAEGLQVSDQVQKIHVCVSIYVYKDIFTSTNTIRLESYA